MVQRLKALLGAPSATSPVWLDSGTVAFIHSVDGSNQICQVSLKDGKRTWRDIGKERIWSIHSHPETGGILFCMDKGGDENEQIYLLPRHEATPKRLTANSGARHFFGGMRPHGQSIVYACNARSHETFDICELNLVTGKERLAVENRDHYNWPAANGLSPDGRFFLYNKLKGQSDNALWMADLKTGCTVRIPDDKAVSAETGPAWRHDGKGFFLLTDRRGEFTSVAYYDLASQSLTEAFSYPYDAEQVALSADDRYLAVLVNEEGYYNLHIYDLVSKSEVNTLKPPRGVIGGYNPVYWSPEGHKLLFTFSCGRRPWDIWLLDLDGDTLRRLTDSLESLGAGELSPEPILGRFNSFDGLSVPYWLYVPAGREAKDLPVVLDIHGGPEGQALPDYDPFIQYLTGEGIAVVAPNVRGSTGYGKTYTHLDDVEKRLDSVRDAACLASHLIEYGVACPSAIAVMGMSYGGYMTLSCAARYPELWACAIDTVGMSDLETFLENTADYRRAHRESEYGSLAEHRQILKEVSPMWKVEEIKAPLMVVHGKNDPRVPVSEAMQIVSRLEALNHPVELLLYEDEGHGISKLKNKLDCYPKMAAFLKKHLGIV